MKLIVIKDNRNNKTEDMLIKRMQLIREREINFRDGRNASKNSKTTGEDSLQYTEISKDKELLNSEVKSVLDKMTNNQSAGLDGIVIEMMEALDDFNTDKITDIINGFYDGET